MHVAMYPNMEKSNKNNRFATMPTISLGCINAQVASIARKSSGRATREIVKLLKKENPVLLEFLMESFAQRITDKTYPGPVAYYMRSELLAHCGMLYRIIRTQLQADEMNDAWGTEDDSSTESTDK